MVVLGFLVFGGPPRFRFLAGRAQVRTEEGLRVYAWAAEFAAVEASAARELAGAGYVRMFSDANPEQRLAAFQSVDGTTMVGMGWSREGGGMVEVSVHAPRRPTRHRGLYSMFFGCGCSARSSVNACIANLKQIEGAKANWALENRLETNAVPRDPDLFGAAAYIRVKPECPMGGHYWIGAAGEPPRCTIPGHAL